MFPPLIATNSTPPTYCSVTLYSDGVQGSASQDHVLQPVVYLMPPSTAVMATRCLGGRLTRMRMTLDVKYVPMSIERSTDSTWGGIESLERTGQGGGAGGAVGAE